MSIFRINKTKNYTVMSNHHLVDKSLSLKAKGLMSYMLSRPDDWDFTELGLVACLKENRTSIRNALKELEERGYLVRKRERKSNGTLGSAMYDLYETPMLENRTLENPTLDNVTQLNTKVTNSANTSLDNKTKNSGNTRVSSIYGVTEIINTDARAGARGESKTDNPPECSQKFAEALAGFEEMRKKIKKPLTQRAKALILKKLNSLAPNDEETQIEILDQSTLNGWQGVFELKDNKTYQRRNKNEPRGCESISELYDDGMDAMKRLGLMNDDESE